LNRKKPSPDEGSKLVNGDRIRQARELKSITQKRLAEMISVSQAAIAQIENGICRPSGDTLGAIAKYTCQPLSFFCQTAAPEFPLGSLLFRSHSSMTRREMVATSRYAQYAYELGIRMRARLKDIDVGIPRRDGADPEKAAQEARRALGVPKGEPVPHLLNLLEWNGALVVCIPAIKSREAFSLWFQDIPVVAVAVNKAGDRGRLSAAHELGHLVLHPGKSRHEVDDSEADRFLAEFLMPRAAISREFSTPVVVSSLAQLKLRWRVPLLALAKRAKDLGVVTDRQYRYLLEQLSALSIPEPVPIEAERPRMLRQMSELLYGDPIDFRTLSSEMKVDTQLVRDMLRQYSPKIDQGEAKLSAKVVRLSRRS
jgi:Zn-dependent peptidase ImmA (M78 family)/DNA-binding XRE family transcriptional regulator